jgi:uncharacterized protein (DUF3084 family)
MFTGDVFKFPGIVAWVCALTIEAAVLASSALMFNSLVAHYDAQLNKQDIGRALLAILLSFVLLLFGFALLVAIAIADAMLLSGSTLAIFIMAASQVTQVLATILFIFNAERYAREELREAKKLAKQHKTQQGHVQCHYCNRLFSPNNIKRHEGKCRCNPTRS